MRGSWKFLKPLDTKKLFMMDLDMRNNFIYWLGYGPDLSLVYEKASKKADIIS